MPKITTTQTTKRISDIHEYEHNPRQNDRAVPAVAASIEEYGFNQPIAVDEKGVILAGHTRYKAAKHLGLELVPVVVVTGLTEQQKKSYRIKDNKLGEIAEWDFDMLQLELEDISRLDFGEFSDFDKLTSFDECDDALDSVPTSLSDCDTSEQETPTKQEEIKAWLSDMPHVTHGDIFKLGNHFIMCGDSTEANDVDRLMNGSKAHYVFTDPPYGVNVGSAGYSNGKIVGDLTQTTIPFMFEQAMRVTHEKAWVAFCGSMSNYSMYARLFDRYVGQMPRCLMWVKENFTIKHVGYHAQYEVIYTGFKPGGGDIWHAERTGEQASDVIRIKRDNTALFVHPTQKPVELAMRFILNHTTQRQSVYEPFSGSGSTLLACERLGRICYAMEIDPHYMQVTMKRFKDETGIEPIKLG